LDSDLEVLPASHFFKAIFVPTKAIALYILVLPRCRLATRLN